MLFVVVVAVVATRGFLLAVVGLGYVFSFHWMPLFMDRLTLISVGGKKPFGVVILPTLTT